MTVSLNEELTDDALAGSLRVYQRRRGHRYSLDDVLTADEAALARPSARRVLDLGAGIGSVALMLAWRLPEARVEGVEAQEVSFRLGQANVRRNGLEARVTLTHADLRGWRSGAGPFDLITGTPPYFPPGTATPSGDAQRAFARIELRGGVEDYLAAARPQLAHGGRVVVCLARCATGRLVAAAEEQGFAVHRRLAAVPRLGRPVLFDVWTLAVGPASAAYPEATFVARDEGGARTGAYHELRRRFGLAPPKGERPSP